MLEDPDYLVIDTRNEYEVSIGTFAGAVNPQTKSFRNSQSGLGKTSIRKHRKVAMGDRRYPVREVDLVFGIGRLCESGTCRAASSNI